MKKYFFDTMMDNKVGKRSHMRKYIGVILKINNYNYFAPLSSPKKSDYDSDGQIRKSSKIVLRIVLSKSTNPVLLGTIKLNNMIPVPLSEIINYNIKNEIDIKYKSLVQDELLWIQKNNTFITKSAESIYKFKLNESIYKNETNRRMLESIIDFKKAEEKCINFKD